MSEDLRRGAARYADAFEALSLAPDSNAKELKRAYRRAVAKHPPDRDEEGFRRVRAAYDLLRQPELALGELLSTETHVQPELKSPPPVELRHALPLATLRAAIADLDARTLLGDKHG